MGLIMRTVGKYPMAMHKFNEALKLEPSNKTAVLEIDLLKRIMILDS